MSQTFSQDDMKVEAEGTVDPPADLADRYIRLRLLALDVVSGVASTADLEDWLEENP